MRGVWVLCALALWLCEVGAQKPPLVAGAEGRKFTKEELQLLASSGKFASKPRLAPPESHKFQLGQKSEPLARKEFIKKFGPRIRDSPTTMDPDQIFLALDTNRDSLVEKEELKGFRTLCVPASAASFPLSNEQGLAVVIANSALHFRTTTGSPDRVAMPCTVQRAPATDGFQEVSASVRQKADARGGPRSHVREHGRGWRRHAQPARAVSHYQAFAREQRAMSDHRRPRRC